MYTAISTLCIIQNDKNVILIQLAQHILTILLALYSVQHWRSTATCAAALELPKLCTGTDFWTKTSAKQMCAGPNPLLEIQTLEESYKSEIWYRQNNSWKHCTEQNSSKNFQYTYFQSSFLVTEKWSWPEWKCQSQEQVKSIKSQVVGIAGDRTEAQILQKKSK